MDREEIKKRKQIELELCNAAMIKVTRKLSCRALGPGFWLDKNYDLIG